MKYVLEFILTCRPLLRWSVSVWVKMSVSIKITRTCSHCFNLLNCFFRNFSHMFYWIFLFFFFPVWKCVERMFTDNFNVLLCKGLLSNWQLKLLKLTKNTRQNRLWKQKISKFAPQVKNKCEVKQIPFGLNSLYVSFLIFYICSF